MARGECENPVSAFSTAVYLVSYTLSQVLAVACDTRLVGLSWGVLWGFCVCARSEALCHMHKSAGIKMNEGRE